MLHIAYVVEEYPPNPKTGGIGVFLQVMARALAARGHRVTVLGVWKDTGTRFDQGVEVREFEASRTPRIGWLRTQKRWREELLRLHREHPIDVVEAMDWQGSFFGVHDVLPRRIPRVVRIQGSQILFGHVLGRPVSRLTSFMERRTFAAADHIVALTDYAYKTTCSLLPIADRPYSIIPNPVDTETFHPRLNDRTVPGLVMFVGTLTKKKGVEELTQAWPKVVSRFPHARLELIAKDTMADKSGTKMSDKLFAMLPRDLHGTVSWRGAVEHDALPELMARAEILVFPSHVETQAIVACEAIALGKPTVFSKLGPGPEVLVHNESGLLVDPHVPNEIADALISFLGDEPLRKRLGDSARKRALDKFALDRVATQNEALYTSLVRG